MCCPPTGASRLCSQPPPHPRALDPHLPSTLALRCCSKNLASRGCLQFLHRLPHPLTWQRSHQSQGTVFCAWPPKNRNFKSSQKDRKGEKISPKYFAFICNCFLIHIQDMQLDCYLQIFSLKNVFSYSLRHARLRSNVLVHLNDRLSNKSPTR